MTQLPEDSPDGVISPLESADRPSSAPIPVSPPRSRTRWLWFGLLLLLILFGTRGIVKGNDSQENARGDRLEALTIAMRLTKMAHLSGGTTRVKAPGRSVNARGDRTAKSILSRWRTLSRSELAWVADWRRRGIIEAAFDTPAVGLKTLRHIGALSPELRHGEPHRKGEPAEEEEVRPQKLSWEEISAAQEVAVWEAIYGTGQLAPQDVPGLKRALDKFELGWFGHLAREQLYTHAGMWEEARAERAAIHASARNLLFWNLWHLFLLVAGTLGLIAFGLLSLVQWSKRFRAARVVSLNRPMVPPLPGERNTPLNQENRDSLAEPPPLPAAASPPLFSYRARLLAFLAYFAVPLLMLPVTFVLKPLSVGWSNEVLARVNVGLYVASAFFSLWLSFGVLRRVGQAEGTVKGSLTNREIAAIVGFRTQNFTGDVWAGVAGHAMTVPLLLIASVISDWLFSQYKTPPHPVLFQFISMSSPFDMALLLLQTAIVAAVVEEAMFRGVFYPALRMRWGVVRGIALSGAIFSLAHPTLPGGFLPLWALGAGFAIAFQRRGSLTASIVMHALNNGTLLLTQYATFGG